MKKYFVFLLIVIGLCQIPSPTMSQRRVGGGSKPVQKPGAAPQKPMPEAVKDEPATVEDPLNGFVENGIPAFASAGNSNQDEAARETAIAISKYDEKSWPALLGAIRKAGFSIIDSEGKILIGPEVLPGNGMAFYDWETNGMLKLSRRALGTTLDEWIGKSLSGVPEVSSDQIANTILRDLRTQANNRESSEKRFWARLIIELGKARETPNDLMTVSAKEAVLDVVQLSIWERRLTGDILAFKARSKISMQRKESGTFFQNASFVTPKFGFVRPGCDLNNEQGLVIDAAANGIGAAHGEFMGVIGKFLGEASKGAAVVEKISKGLTGVNIALSWGKLIAAHMMLKAEMTVEGPLPLVRTGDSIPGQTRPMKARIWSEVGNLQYINCVRTALNTATGLDFSVPSEGPLADRDVGWELTGESSFAGQKSSKTGVFKPFVNLEAPKDAKRNPSEQISDSNGETTMNLVGAPKIPSVAFIKAVKVKKTATVRVSVALKSARDFEQNWIDIGGATLGVVLSGPIGILSTLPELGFRNKRPIISKNVPVEDREPCEENWTGTITFKKKTLRTERAPKGTRTIEEDETVDYFVKGKAPAKRPKVEGENEESGAIYDDTWNSLLEFGETSEANVLVSIRNSNRYVGEFDADICCSQEERTPGKGKSGVEEIGDLNRDVLVQFIWDGESLHFNLEMYFSNLTFMGIERTYQQTTGFICPLDRGRDGTFDRPKQIMPLIGQNHTINPRASVANGVQTISGSDRIPVPNGEITVTWELSKCK